MHRDKGIGKLKSGSSVCGLLLGALAALAFSPSSALGGPPVVLSTSFSHVTTTSALLEARVNPEGKTISYSFEYGPSECDLGSNSCSSSSELEGIDSSHSTSPQLISAPLRGLEPNSIYHFRIEVSNGKEPPASGSDTVLRTFVQPPLPGICSNENFRSTRPSAFLPDCRVYEQASPQDKNGADAIGAPNEVQASADGDAVAYFSAAGIPGAVGAQDFETFLSRRGDGDWLTRGVYPPASDGAVSRNAGWTPDLSLFFSNVADSFAGPWLFQGRTSATEAFTHISSGGKEAFLAGTSENGSLVYFQSESQLTPEATPGKDNLYLWDRGTDTISLGGVLSDSACGMPPCVPAGGSFAGAYEWFLAGNASEVSRRGSKYYVQPFHAISNDGSKAYFTAEGGQIYLREDAAGPSPSTVHVSASQRANPDTNGIRPAAFMAATPSGSKALFTSPEKLTEDATTGPEPPPASIGRANLGDGSAKDLEYLLAKGNGVTSDGEFIYWANAAEGTIGRAKIGASKAESSDDKFIEGAGVPQDVTVQGEFVYWTNDAGKGESGEGSIGRAKIGPGGAEDVKADFIPGIADEGDPTEEVVVAGPRGIDADSEFIYWVNAGVGEFPIAGAIGRAKLDGSEPEEEFVSQLASGDVAVGNQKIYRSRSNRINGFLQLANLDGTQSGGEAALIIPGAKEAPDLAADATHLYWTNPTTGVVGRVGLEPSGEPDISKIEPEFIAAAGRPKGLAADSSHLYWAANQDALPNPGNDLYQFDAATGKLSDLAVDTKDPNGAEVKGVLGTSADGSYIYFAANGDLDGSGPAETGDCEAGAGGGGFLVAGGNCSLYLAHEGQVRFIAPLDAGGGVSDATNWEPQGQPTTLPAVENTARVSADGNALLFRSQEQLTAYDNNGTAEFYRYDAAGGQIVCVSCNPSGEAPLNPPSLESIEPALPVVEPPGKPAILTRNLSSDGNRIFFETPDKLVAEDTDGEEGCPRGGQASVPACQDVYEWEAKGTGSCESSDENGGCLYLLSSGTSAEPAFFADASESGDDAFIFTRSALVPQDQDTLQDAYDARVEGGLASQNVVAPPACEGDACKPGTAVPPPFQAPQTPGFQGPGNVKEKPKHSCPKGKKAVRSKGKTRCVDKKKGKQHKSKRGARKSGRAGR